MAQDFETRNSDASIVPELCQLIGRVMLQSKCSTRLAWIVVFRESMPRLLKFREIVDRLMVRRGSPVVRGCD